jgi:hypothetical protein
VSAEQKHHYLSQPQTDRSSQPKKYVVQFADEPTISPITDAFLYLIGGQLWQIFSLQFLAGILAEHCIDKGILHITNNTDGWINLGELYLD